MPKRVFPKAYQNLIDSILYTRRRLGKPKTTSTSTSKYLKGASRKQRPRHPIFKQRCTRRR